MADVCIHRLALDDAQLVLQLLRAGMGERPKFSI
jgi:hypothetical protein